MKVTLVAITPEIEETIVRIARVSSSRKNKDEEPDKLLNYLIKNKHWSPFEHGYITLEIITSKAIGIQLLRHRSFTFQEFSQRYQDIRKLGDMFQPVEIRKQAENNRQSSKEEFNPLLDTELGHGSAGFLIDKLLCVVEELYTDLLKAGVARECARMILPMTTTTKIYMTGSVRSWIHFLDIRDDSHAQKEIQEVAKAIKEIFVKELPIISKARGWSR